MSGQPYAEITRVGRWLHSIEIHDGMCLVTREDWYAFGRRRAERKAARVLRRYMLAEQRRQNPTRVEVPSGLSRESNPGVSRTVRGARVSRNLLQDIADAADALTEPHQHLEPVYDYDHHRNKRMKRVYATVQPGLIKALWEAVEPATKPDGDVRPAGYRSAPPLCLEAVSRLTVIQIGVVRWCWSLRLELRDNTESNLRALVGAAGAMDSDTQATFLDELRQWRTWCAVMTGWQSPAYAPNVACPVDECGQRNTVRINLARKTGMCTACHATWDEATIGILADYIRTTTNAGAAA